MKTINKKIKKILSEQFKNPESVQFRTIDGKPRLVNGKEWQGEETSVDDIDFSGFKDSGVLVGFGETSSESYFIDIFFKDGKVTGFEVEVEDN